MLRAPARPWDADPTLRGPSRQVHCRGWALPHGHHGCHTCFLPQGASSLCAFALAAAAPAAVATAGLTTLTQMLPGLLSCRQGTWPLGPPAPISAAASALGPHFLPVTEQLPWAQVARPLSPCSPAWPLPLTHSVTTAPFPHYQAPL